MTRGHHEARRLIEAIDDAAARPGRMLRSHPTAHATVVGVAVVAAVAAAAVPVRESIGVANIALVLGIVIGAVGSRTGLAPGALVGLASGMAFAMLHSVPHGLPRVEDEQDLATVALLVGWGLFAGWLHDRRERLEHAVRADHDDLGRLHRVAEVASKASTTIDELIDTVAEEMTAELELRDCYRVVAPIGRRRELRHNGLIGGAPADASPAELGRLVADGVGIDLRDGSHLVLQGRENTEITRRQLRVGVMLADYAVAVMESKA